MRAFRRLRLRAGSVLVEQHCITISRVDSGRFTIVSSPLYAVDPTLLGDGELSDSEIIALAKTHGRRIA